MAGEGGGKAVERLKRKGRFKQEFYKGGNHLLTVKILSKIKTQIVM